MGVLALRRIVILARADAGRRGSLRPGRRSCRSLRPRPGASRRTQRSSAEAGMAVAAVGIDGRFGRARPRVGPRPVRGERRRRRLPAVELSGRVERVGVVGRIIIGLDRSGRRGAAEVVVAEEFGGEQAAYVGIELADRVPVPVQRLDIPFLRIFDLQEMPQLLEAEAGERDQNRRLAVRAARPHRIVEGQARRILARRPAVELRLDPEGVEDVRAKRHVKHLFDRDAHDHRARLVGVDLGGGNA